MRPSYRIVLCAVLLAAGSGAASWASHADRGGDEPQFGDDYQLGDQARVLYAESGVSILRAGGSGPVEDDAGVNVPLFAGDTLETDRTQRAEMQLAGGTLVRVDRDSAVTLLSLPSPGAEYRDNTVLQLRRGAIRVALRIDGEDEFRIDTPAASAYLLHDGDFRVELRPGDRTRVLSRSGVAEVSGEGGSVLVRSGMRTEAAPGERPTAAQPFNTLAADAFDRWVDEREDAVRVLERRHVAYHDEGDSGYDYDDDSGSWDDESSDDSSDDRRDVYVALPYEVRPYYAELSSSGRWVFVADFGWCWYPLGVSVGWRPYRAGYWHYGPRGYFWVSHEPWGWAPYHYGRWNWVGGYGWCWVPGRVFAGAWVSWSWGSAYVGWGPLDYWNRPAYIGSPYYGYYDPDCWTFVSYAHLRHRRYDHHAVPVGRIGSDLRRHAVVTRAPRVAPRQLGADPAARTRAFQAAAADPRVRVARIDRSRPPAERFTDVESRLARRLPRLREERDGRRPGAERGRRLSPAGPKDPGRAGGTLRQPGAGGRGGIVRGHPRRAPRPDVDTGGRGPSREGRREGAANAPTRRPAGPGNRVPARPPANRPAPSGRKPSADAPGASPAVPATPRPRRIAPEDDSRRNSGRSPAAERDRARRGGRDSGTSESPSRRVRERVRDMYRRVAPKREPRRDSSPNRPPSAQRPARPPAPKAGSGGSSSRPRSQASRPKPAPRPKPKVSRPNAPAPRPKARPSQPKPKAAPKNKGSGSKKKDGGAARSSRKR